VLAGTVENIGNGTLSAFRGFEELLELIDGKRRRSRAMPRAPRSGDDA
jgi:hypothetical protein